MTKTAREQELMLGAPAAADKRVTLENFYQPPFNRWSFRHMREIAPFRNVPAGITVTILGESPQDLSDAPVPFPDGETPTLRDSDTDGFIVLHKGRIVYERYLNNQSPGTQHLMFSVTKSVTGAIVLMLVEQEIIDEVKTVEHYIPELVGTAFGDATVQQLLDMTNSVLFDEVYDDPKSHIGRYMAALMPDGSGIYSNIVSHVEKESGYDHGDVFHYVTPTTEVLGWIVRRVTGKSLAWILHDMIWAPMGAEHDGYYWLDYVGTAVAGAGLCITLRDAARFGQMILQDGEIEGRKVLPTSVAQRIKTKRNADVFGVRDPDPWYGEIADSYHDQWWGYAGCNAISAIGVHGQHIYINSDAEAVIVRQASQPAAKVPNERDASFALYAAAQAVG